MLPVQGKSLVSLGFEEFFKFFAHGIKSKWPCNIAVNSCLDGFQDILFAYLSCYHDKWNVFQARKTLKEKLAEYLQE